MSYVSSSSPPSSVVLEAPAATWSLEPDNQVDDDTRRWVQCESSKLLSPELVDVRPVDYANVKHLHVITIETLADIANDIFGNDGWKCVIRRLQVDSSEKSGQCWDICVSAIVRVVVHNQAHHEDIGVAYTNGVYRDKKEALKEMNRRAVCDGVKRAFRQFGDALGNCLYGRDLQHTFLQYWQDRRPPRLPQPPPPPPPPSSSGPPQNPTSTC